MRTIAAFFIPLIVVLATFSASHAQNAVSLDHVDGLTGDGKLRTSQPLVFHIRLTNGTGQAIGGSTNGFRVYSPDGAAWSPITADSVALSWGNIYDGGLYFSSFGVTGTGADTIGFGGFAMQMPGLPDDFDAIAYMLTTQVASDQVGKTLCLDSAYYPPIGHWVWALGPGGEIDPAWDGPHCWEIGGCCQGFADDPNGSGAGPDIADLVYLVNYMFNGGPVPPCLDETDHNGDHTIVPDIGDLVWLVNFMFNGGPALAACG
ncbi:MAG: hypothetical protein ABIE70_11325 [bacterium]